MLPIRKISPDTVALTSYYGKTFVRRSGKKVNDYGHWLCNKIMLTGLDGSDNSISNLATGDVFDNTIKQPRLYSLLAQNFISFTANGFDFNFDYRNIAKFYDQETIKVQAANGLVLLAQNNKDEILAIDYNGVLFKLGQPNEELGTLESFLGIDVAGAPTDFAELRVMGKNISVGLALAYDIGFTELCDRLKVVPRKVPTGTRLNLEANEYALSFSDVSLIFSKEDKLATMILAGFNEYDKSIRRYALAAMDNPNVYLNILESAGLSTRYLREIQHLNNLFVDSITKELLIEMKEPTTFAGLLVRGSEMLLLDEHPDQLDMKFMRIKGYERIAGAVYSELVHSIRSHSARPGKGSKPLELHPYAVWSKIVSDPSMAMVSDLNPIQNLKEMEAVTYSGTGGRSTRTMTRSTRQYHDSDMGVISESTVDSSSVGVNIYTSADPQFKSVRGTTRPFDFAKNGPAAMLSTSALISPGSDHDDPKRVNDLLFLGANLINNLSKTGNSLKRQSVAKCFFETKSPTTIEKQCSN